MSLLDALISALDALRKHKLRSALTMLGIIIGVAAVIAMIAVGSGAREQVFAQTRSLGTNLLVIWSQPISQSRVRLAAGTGSTLVEEDAVAIAKEIPAVQVTAPILNGSAQIVAGGTNWTTTITGADLGWFEARAWNVELGRGFEPHEISTGALVALLGQSVARKLFGNLDPIGQEIRVRNVPLMVVGVMVAKGQSTGGRDQDDVVFLPLLTARQRVLGRTQADARAVSLIFVKVRDGEDLTAVESEVAALLRERHRLQPHQENDFGMRNLADVAAVREASAQTLAQLLAAVAAISLAVGGIGIMNIMLVSVTERTREIGLRLAVGARQRDIRRQFLMEAIVLAVIGGAVGVLMGVGAAHLVANSVGWPLLIHAESVVLAVLFSGVVGIFFGWYPALRASQLDPIEALRD